MIAYERANGFISVLYLFISEREMEKGFFTRGDFVTF